MTCLFTAIALAYLSWCGVSLSNSTEQRAAIVRAAQEHGIDPTAALAIAQRESDFNPRAKSSKTIRGMFQMRGDLRQQYGVGDSDDPYKQAKGWAPFFKDTKSTMSKELGRDVTDAEGYAGHHFGASRAAKMFKMEPDTPVDQVFTPYERSLNPHFDKAGTVGNLLGSVTSDIDKRRASFGGGAASPPMAPLDLSGFEEAGPATTGDSREYPGKSAALDLSGFEPIAAPARQSSRAAPALDLSSFEAV